MVDIETNPTVSFALSQATLNGGGMCLSAQAVMRLCVCVCVCVSVCVSETDRCQLCVQLITLPAFEQTESCSVGSNYGDMESPTCARLVITADFLKLEVRYFYPLLEHLYQK